MWTGAVVVALAAIAFAKGAELCYALFVRLLGQSRAWPFVVTPLGFALLVVGDHTIYTSQLGTRADSPAHRYRYGFPLLGSLPVRHAMRRNEQRREGVNQSGLARANVSG